MIPLFIPNLWLWTLTHIEYPIVSPFNHDILQFTLDKSCMISGNHYWPHEKWQKKGKSRRSINSGAAEEKNLRSKSEGILMKTVLEMLGEGEAIDLIVGSNNTKNSKDWYEPVDPPPPFHSGDLKIFNRRTLHFASLSLSLSKFSIKIHCFFFSSNSDTLFLYLESEYWNFWYKITT